MKTLLLLVLATASAHCFAQQTGAQPFHDNRKTPDTAYSGFQRNISAFKSKPDTGIDKNILPYNGIPNAMRMKTAPDVYEGNNGQGQDIYRSQLDKMAILKPDSTFQQGMPNSIRKYELSPKPYPDTKIPPRVWIQPKKESKTPKQQ